MRTFYLAALLLALPLQAAEPPSPDPLWDGHESVAAYAQRVHLPPTKQIDLGNGVTLDLVLIPAGQFIMGTAEPAKPEITVYSGQVLICIGGALSLVLLVIMLSPKRTGRQFSFSLRGLLAFSLACSVMVWGGVRWYQALAQIREYDAAMERYNATNESPAHPVLISKAFYMGNYPVTQAQYEALTGKNPSQFKGAQNPVETIFWLHTTVFCMRLSERLAAQALEARLPTEAEWEYACRAGTRTRFHSGDADSDLDAVAWYDKNSGGKTHPVGGKKANVFGLYDMHGNVWQWCEDFYMKDYVKLSATDPVNIDPNQGFGNSRVARGGAWNVPPHFCRSAFRLVNSPSANNSAVGFRVVVPSSRTPP